jgi:ribosome-associated protein
VSRSARPRAPAAEKSKRADALPSFASASSASPAGASVPDRSAVSRKFAIAAARLASNTHCVNIALLDVRGISPVTDFLLLATGTSPRQMRAVASEIAELGEKQGYAPLNADGYEGENWILVDFIDVILHVFSNDARAYYDLDNLWGDARRIEWK